MDDEQTRSIAGLLGPSESLLFAQNGFTLEWVTTPDCQFPLLFHWWFAVTDTHFRYGQFSTSRIVSSPKESETVIKGKFLLKFTPDRLVKNGVMNGPVELGDTIERHFQIPLSEVSQATQNQVFGVFNPKDVYPSLWECVPFQLGRPFRHLAGISLHFLELSDRGDQFGYRHLYSADEDFGRFLTALASAQSNLLKGNFGSDNSGPASTDALERLAKLYADGLLSEEEFRAAKARELGL